MNLEEWKVYKHTSPSGKVYIGITHCKPEKRWCNGKGYKRNTHFWRAIQKYGWDNFNHEIIADKLSKGEAEKMEIELVKQYKSSQRSFGYNIAEGGHVLTQESRSKISATRKAKGIPSHNKGKHLSAETRAKISASHMGKSSNHVFTEEERDARRKRMLGSNNPNYNKPMSEERKQMLIDLHSKAVVQINGNEKVWFKSAVEAGKATGIASCNITRVCRKQRETAGGYRWEYAV